MGIRNKFIKNKSFKETGPFRANGTYINILVFMAFFVYAAVANWSIVLGENLMKWDIWDAEYPLEVLVSDALHKGQIILWNPLFRYGSPHYAAVGTPVWYPVTLLLAVRGYTPRVLAFSYVVHIAVGGFGMYLLGKQELLKRVGTVTCDMIVSAVIAGLIYCSSGVFLSNAEHIMIIISIAWIPYIFYFMRAYLEKGGVLYAMLSGGSAAMIIFGGYPEIFYNVFLFLGIYTLYFTPGKDGNIVKTILNALKHYVAVCICTVSCSAVTVIPFLHMMGLMTRTNGASPMPMNIGLNAFFSLFFPNTGSFISYAEISMANYYLGLLTVILLPAIIKYKNKDNYFYIGMAILSAFLCLGLYSFIHGFLYRFFPMYSNFRFPTLNRCILTMFMMLCVVNVIYDVQQRGITRTILRSGTVLFLLVLGSAAAAGLFGNLQAGEGSSRYVNFSNCAYISAVILGIYMLVFCVLYMKLFAPAVRRVLLGMAVLAELLTFYYVTTPSTIAVYSPTEFLYNDQAKRAIEQQFSELDERVTSTEFANAQRASSGLNSRHVVFNKLFDEGGYVSVQLQKTQDYMETYLRVIKEQNPEIYFTNDVVGCEDVDYYEWANSGAVMPEQIYVENEQTDHVGEKVRFEPVVTGVEALAWDRKEEKIHIYNDTETGMSAGADQTGRIRLYLDSAAEKEIELAVTYIDMEGNGSEYGGVYQIQNDDTGQYIELYMPDIERVYSDIYVSAPDLIPENVEMIDVDRMRKDRFVNVSHFGFNEIEMDVTAPTDGYVVVLQAKYDGWKVYVDGAEDNITEVDRCFMGIKVPEGSHNIVFRFVPADFYLGLAVSCVFVFLLLLTVCITVIQCVRKVR